MVRFLWIYNLMFFISFERFFDCHLASVSFSLSFSSGTPITWMWNMLQNPLYLLICLLLFYILYSLHVLFWKFSPNLHSNLLIFLLAIPNFQLNPVSEYNNSFFFSSNISILFFFFLVLWQYSQSFIEHIKHSYF